MKSNFDLIIKDGTLIDGTGRPSYTADIGISRGEIVKIGDIKEDAENVINAKELTVSPGFIDMHTHADLAISVFPNAECYIMQGVTTSLVGNCGISMAPINPNNVNLLKSYISPLPENFNYKWDWKTSAEYFEKIRKNKTAINLAYLVGQGTLRIAVRGFEIAKSSKIEIEKMKDILKKELEEGAFGLSTGLVYSPGSYTKTEELLDITSILTQYGALYSTHMRSESNQLLESVDEAIKIAEKNKISVEISHLKAIGENNWGKVKQSLRMLENARNRGVNINCDVYPYTSAMSTAISLLPPWTLEGGVNKMLERLTNPEERIKIKKDITTGKITGENWIKEIGWKSIIVAECPLDRNAEGKSLEAILKIKGHSCQPFEAFFDWLLNIKAEATMIFVCMCEEDVKQVISYPNSIIVSDSWVIAPNGGGKPHPRGYGTFPRVIRKYVLEEKILTLEEAVKKMTSLPAKKIGLKNRGILKEGYWADITIFDKNKIKDEATYNNPHQYPKGIHYVIVNGKLVVNNGKITKIKPGKILKRFSE